MTNCFVNTIVFVDNIEESKLFYSEFLQIKIEKDYGNIVFFENQLVLHDANSILKTVKKDQFEERHNKQGDNNILLYFETDNLTELYNKVKEKVKIIHGIEEQNWGQKVFRFYDPDNHIVEFGEPFKVKN